MNISFSHETYADKLFCALIITSCRNPVAPKARFSNAFQTETRQKVTIEMPKTYELSCILMALTGYRNVLEGKDLYTQDIKKTF